MHESGVLYDDIALIENIHLWVTTMSSSFLRPFRHTATVVALACATGLCGISKEQTESTAKVLNLKEAESRKKGANEGRIRTLQEKIDEGNQRRETCENTVKDFFDTVFVHRYRDVDPKIRTDCVEALGTWILILPRLFFEGTYLRYLGWLLSDQNGPTRHEVIKQLERIMKKKDNVGGIRHFIERFRGRMVEMATQDAESSVRSSAVDLLDMIREAGMLEPNDIDVIGKLIFDSEQRVRKAVVGFFVSNIEDLFESKVEEIGGEEVLEEAFTLDDEDKENPSSGWIKLKCLAELLLSYDSQDTEESSEEYDENVITDGHLNAAGAESRYSLAAEALYDKVPEIQDWEMLARYLLFDHSKKQQSKSVGANILESFKLEEKEEVVLLEILHAAVKLNLTHMEEHDKKKRGARTASLEAQESVAQKLASLLPRLLKKFGPSPKTSTAVLRLEHVLNLDVFQELRQDSTAYKDLLHEIQAQFKSHADQRVLKEASVALLHAQAYEDLEETTDEQIQSLWEDTLDDFRKRFPKSSEITVRGDSKVDLLVGLGNSVNRLSKLAAINNPVEHLEAVPHQKPRGAKDRAASFAPIDMILELVGRGVLDAPDPEIDEEEDKLVVPAIKTALFYFMWKGRSLKEQIDASHDIPDIQVNEIKERMETCSNRLVRSFSSRAGLDSVRLTSTGALLDLHNVFYTILSNKLKHGQPATLEENDRYAHLRTLVRHVLPDVQEEITSIFVVAEKQYAKKAKKTLEAPADDDDPEDVDDESEDEEEEAPTEADRQAETLKAELQLCDLTSKIVLAIYAGVIDSEGPLKGKLRSRILRNRKKLGQNMSQILAVLDEPTAKLGGKKSHKKKAPAPAAAKKVARSAERVEDEDEGEEELEEGTEEDLRRRELLDDDPPISVEDNDGAAGEDEDEDMLGD
jgi:cohesin complex subunit SA-1/2